LDVIEDLLSVYLLITYDATNYDTTAWAAAEANAMNNNVGQWIDSPTEIIELIEMLCTSTKGNFIRKDSDGKYTFRFTDIEAASTATIIKGDYQDTPRIHPDGDSMLSVVRVGYNKDIDGDSFSWNKQDSERTRIFSKYTKDRDLELETALLSNADAQELAVALYELFDDAEPIVELVLWSKYLSLEIMDVITVPVQRVDGRDMIHSVMLRIWTGILSLILTLLSQNKREHTALRRDSVSYMISICVHIWGKITPRGSLLISTSGVLLFFIPSWHVLSGDITSCSFTPNGITRVCM